MDRNFATPEWQHAESDEVFAFPTTAGQQGFWYLDQLQPGNPAFNIAIRFHLEGPLRVATLEQAFNALVCRHETLRTTFVVMDGTPMQVIAPHMSITLNVDDLCRLPAAGLQGQADSRASEEGRLPFDLAQGPLIRARLLRLDAESHVLLVTVHHIIADGWSTSILLQELVAIYEAYCHGHAEPLPELPLQYGDFAIWQEQWLKSDDLERQLSYWTCQLANLPTLEVPTDRPRPAVLTSNGQLESILLAKNLTGSLEKICQREHVTLFMLTLSALKILLKRRCGINDVFVGTLISGRSRVELESMIGPFINSLVLRCDLSDDPPFFDLLARVREVVLQAFEQQDLPFERVVEALNPKRDLSRHPVFQINFIHQKAFLRPMQVAGLSITPIPSISPGAIYDLNFVMVERAEGWRVSCEYNTDLYEPETVRNLLDHFQSLLREIASNPARRLSEFILDLSGKSKHSKEIVEHPARVETQLVAPVETAPEVYVAPRDSIESKLVEMWEQVLKTQRVSVTSDFFDIGGHSLLAARLVAQIGRAFGKKMPLATFLQSPTIESFAVRLRAGNATGPSNQVHVIKEGGTRPPWIVPTIQPKLYRLLAHHLSPDQPVWGLTSPELNALPDGFSLEDVAAVLVKALQSAQPHGPYYLGGWCVSGVISFEIARQLCERGEEVALLVLLDSNSPTYNRQFRTLRAFPIRMYFYYTRYIHHLKLLFKQPPGGMFVFLRRGIQSKLNVCKDRMRKIFGRQRKPSPDNDVKHFAYLQGLAAARHEPKPTTVPIVLFRSEILQTGWFKDPALGWSKLAQGGLNIHELPGGHADMFVKPAVEQLALHLSSALAKTARTQVIVNSPIQSTDVVER